MNSTKFLKKIKQFINNHESFNINNNNQARIEYLPKNITEKNIYLLKKIFDIYKLLRESDDVKINGIMIKVI